ncbi:MAG: pilus assembly protein TadG-related protein [Hyphomicrobiaceae bacterium]
MSMRTEQEPSEPQGLLSRIAGSFERFCSGHTAGTFARDERGTTAMIFALTVAIVVSMVGGAVDYGRAVKIRDQMQNAVDAAILAAARSWQLDGDLTAAQNRALAFYNKNKPLEIETTITAFGSDPVRNTLVLEAGTVVPAPFLSLVRVEGLTVQVRAEAMLAVGGNSELNLEISMMLDVTGSMSGQKIVDLKAAAKDLIDIVVWDDQSQYTSRVALAPFAESVRVPSSWMTTIRGAELSSGTSTTPGHRNYRFTNASGSTKTYGLNGNCVTERIGTEKYTDAAPSVAKVGRLYTNGGSCQMSADNEIIPLSADRTMLKAKIDALDIAGSTAGQLGTAWAWYLLSPNWASVFPTGRRPVAYGTPATHKIAVLMTDGEYNTGYCNGVNASNSYGSNDSQINCNMTNGSSPTQAASMCTAMKATGITVYTVGFELGGNATAITTLRNCATDTSKFYNAEDGAALRAAFRDIALQIATLRLSQ